MARYRIYYTGTAEAWVEVDADSAEEADRIAEEEELPAPDVCVQCAGHGQRSGVVIDGTWDGWEFSDVRKVDHD